MAQIITGIRSILSHPIIYNAMQSLVGAYQFRAHYTREYIRPFSHAKILDIGCGTGEILNFLPLSVEYYGFDLNKNYIRYAKKKYGHRGTFICNDINNQLKDLPQFDIVLAMGLLHHLDDAEVQRLFNLSTSVLKKEGRLITFDGCYIENQSRFAKFMISRDRGQNIRFPEEYKALTQSNFQNVKIAIRHDLLRIPYTHIIMECQK